MTFFMNNVKTELDNLIQLRDDLMKDPVPADKVAITTKKQRSKTYYYRTVLSGTDRKRIYLGDRLSPMLHKCVRSAYKYELLRVINNDISLLHDILTEYESFEKSAMVAKLSPVLADVPFDVEFSTIMKKLREWASADYDKNPKPFGDKVILADDGRRVRSKSECIIYNMLLHAGIPFRYDAVIKLKRINRNGVVEVYYESPDFQIMCPDGHCILIEHAGKLTSMQYADDLAKKLQTYQLCGYYLGYSLFVTSDDIDGGIDSSEIKRVIEIIRGNFPYL